MNPKIDEKALAGGVLIGQPKPVKLAVARFCYGMREHPHVGSWLAQTCHDFVTSGVCAGLDEFVVNRAPVYAARNLAAKRAVAAGADYLIMIDATDTVPDVARGAPPFVKTALSYATRSGGPVWVSAPVPMANQCVNVHREVVGDDGARHLELVPLEAAAGRSGFERVPATGTGLVLADVRCFTQTPEPWFAFQYADPSCCEVSAGEDVMFTARLHEAGVPVVAAWDCWCGHAKEILLGRPPRPTGE